MNPLSNNEAGGDRINDTYEYEDRSTSIGLGASTLEYQNLPGGEEEGDSRVRDKFTRVINGLKIGSVIPWKGSSQ